MTISVIMPTRNEAARIGQSIEYLRLGNNAADLEIIVADGQSHDATRAVAARAGARVLACEANRGLQQNAAAQIASGEILWFLHADSTPHPQALEYLIQVSQNPKICGGNFRLRFERSTSVSALWPGIFEIIARLQRRYGVYYGDSGIWVRREVFQLLGGFEAWPLFEDYDFARRLENFARRHGLRTEYSALPLTASSRRFERAPARVLRQWIKLQALFQIGVAPEQLAAIYFRERG